ncbi:hypothetical protein [Streptomyces viridosporus]|uniref:hypothetical protein n=1 Tax=Streptomyces viridosporus TaxID=67581 RepID=UPI0036F5D073
MRRAGCSGPRQMVFAAGFPAVCAQEYEAVRQVAVEVEGAVSVAAVMAVYGDAARALIQTTIDALE